LLPNKPGTQEDNKQFQTWWNRPNEDFVSLPC